MWRHTSSGAFENHDSGTHVYPIFLLCSRNLIALFRVTGSARRMGSVVFLRPTALLVSAGSLCACAALVPLLPVRICRSGEKFVGFLSYRQVRELGITTRLRVALSFDWWEMCLHRHQCHSRMWVWSLPGRSGSMWILLRGPCTEMWCWRTIATLSHWVSLLYYRTLTWEQLIFCSCFFFKVNYLYWGVIDRKENLTHFCV